MQMLVDTTPGKTFCFFNSKSTNLTRQNFSFFEGLENTVVTNFQIAELDRYLFLEFENGHVLQFELFGPRANVCWFNESGDLRESFRKRFNPTLLQSLTPSFQIPNLNASWETKTTLKQTLKALNPLFSKPQLAAISNHLTKKEVSEKDVPDMVGQFHRQLLESPVPVRFEDGEIGVLPAQIAENVDRLDQDISEAIAAFYYRDRSLEKLSAEKKRYLGVLKKSLTSVQQKIRQRADAHLLLEKAQEAKKTADVIMANIHLEGSATQFHLNDFYHEREQIEITLNKGERLQERAERLYSKAKHLENEANLAESRLAEYQHHIQKLNLAITKLEELAYLNQLKKWEKEFGSLLPRNAKSSNQVSTGYSMLNLDEYELWVGRNAQGNDQLLRDAHKEDIWFHARGVPGSHVLLRMQRNHNWPDKQVLEKAASVAAYYSKAKGAAMSPVQAAKRKHVRKPKGAAPGTVFVEQEQVFIVTPNKPDFGA